MKDYRIDYFIRAHEHIIEQDLLEIRSGKKLVKTALFSYVFILAIDLVLSAIQSLI